MEVDGIPSPSNPQQVALVSSKLGYVHRGFEAFTRTLFDLIGSDTNIVLYKGAGDTKQGERVVRTIWFEGGWLSRLGLSQTRRMIIQERCYGFAMLPSLLRSDFDLIHFSEVELGNMLHRWRRLFRLKYRLLFSNGAPAPPSRYQHFDVIQEVNQVYLDDALSFGIPTRRLHLVPYGVDCQRFSPAPHFQRRHLRQKYGIPSDKAVVLCVATIKREHKRIDWLIQEFSKCDPASSFLIVAGQKTSDTPELEAMARDLLGSRYRFLVVPHEDIHELYQLSDVFALSSVREGLPNVVLEAMACGIPVVTHEAPLFQWAVGNDASFVDMNRKGQLAARLNDLIRQPIAREAIASKNLESVRSRFSWTTLRPEYLNLYRYVASDQWK